MAKIPVRTCVGCRKSGPKELFLRIVHSKDAGVVADISGKISGRGAYLCRSGECLKKAKKGGRLGRALRTALSESVLNQISDELLNNSCNSK